jgi:cytochrome c oxidase cbb3-type subunit 1
MVIPHCNAGAKYSGDVKGAARQTKGQFAASIYSAWCCGFILTVLMNIFAALPPLSGLVAFTWFNTARLHAMFYGFFTLTMFGAIYYLMPRVAGLEFPFPS